MVVVSGDQVGTDEERHKRSGKPLSQTAGNGGALWSYGPQWTAMVSEGKVKEVWVAAK